MSDTDKKEIGLMSIEMDIKIAAQVAIEDLLAEVARLLDAKNSPMTSEEAGKWITQEIVDLNDNGSVAKYIETHRGSNSPSLSTTKTETPSEK